jgi:hypothetical protein
MGTIDREDAIGYLNARAGRNVCIWVMSGTSVLLDAAGPLGHLRKQTERGERPVPRGDTGIYHIGKAVQLDLTDEECRFSIEDRVLGGELSKVLMVKLGGVTIDIHECDANPEKGD